MKYFGSFIRGDQISAVIQEECFVCLGAKLDPPVWYKRRTSRRSDYSKLYLKKRIIPKYMFRSTISQNVRNRQSECQNSFIYLIIMMNVEIIQYNYPNKGNFH